MVSPLLRLEQLAFELPGIPLWPEGKPYDSLVFTHVQGRYWLELAPGEAADPDLVGDLVIQCELDDGGIESVLIGKRHHPNHLRTTTYQSFGGEAMSSDFFSELPVSPATSSASPMTQSEHPSRLGSIYSSSQPSLQRQPLFVSGQSRRRPRTSPSSWT